MNNLFAEECHLNFLSGLGDSLGRLDKSIGRGVFAPELEASLARSDGSRGGRPPFDPLRMFRALTVQRHFDLGDEALGFRLNDSLPFMRFAGLEFGGKMPDARTIWKFKEELARSGAMGRLFSLFLSPLEEAGLAACEGRMVDAAFAEAPGSGNAREGSAELNADGVPGGWGGNELGRKDGDAERTKRRNEARCGCENRVKADKGSKPALSYATTPANVHGSGMMGFPVPKGGDAVWADARYVGAEGPMQDEVGKIICEKGLRGSPLTEGQGEPNGRRSNARRRIEHVFGRFMTATSGCMRIGTIGIAGARFGISLSNLLYNMLRAGFVSYSNFILAASSWPPCPLDTNAPIMLPKKPAALLIEEPSLSPFVTKSNVLDIFHFSPISIYPGKF